MVLKIKDDIYCMSFIEWEVKEYMSLDINKGTTYNSYLILDKENVLIDPPRIKHLDELKLYLKDIADLKIDYIIPNPSGLDHNECLEKLVEITGAKVVTTKIGKYCLDTQFDTKDWEFIIINNGDEITIGNKTLRFITDDKFRYLLTYCVENKILFSNELFGQHTVYKEKVDLEVGHKIMLEAKEFFANILLPNKDNILKMLKILKDLNLEYICPSHGIIWHKMIDEILLKYRNWSSGVYKNTAVIAYATIYYSTEKIARALGEGLAEGGVNVTYHRLDASTLNIVVRDILDAKYVIIGSPTINTNVHPKVGMLLTYIEGLKPYNKKIGVAFGSYGWEEYATKKINEFFEKLGFKVISGKILTRRFAPGENDLRKIKEFGKKLAKIKLDKFL
ncbi:FprA family A-type flavoprotein [Methanocaldococcus fervens]|uniref:Flavodoxin/nitric oxide synthase n=1 Tax=Methanocaldococcus fervens (strain DSM 4213 / JCM 15782 / AG86) TaxID=573064 RepID=C7P5N1_METFA|nr:FprA family A-type flavoprotein [Methanocaldococcus fervens]ACV23863.1 flavodoxin/nitric oxide synthase [Methanocaldococcus fervens AG86]